VVRNGGGPTIGAGFELAEQTQRPGQRVLISTGVLERGVGRLAVALRRLEAAAPELDLGEREPAAGELGMVDAQRRGPQVSGPKPARARQLEVAAVERKGASVVPDASVARMALTPHALGPGDGTAVVLFGLLALAGLVTHA